MALDWRIRLAPAGALLVLIVVRMFKADFLANDAFWSISWWTILFTSLTLLMGYLLTPVFMKTLNKYARHWFLPGTVFVALFLGLLWILQALYNALPLPDIQLFGKLTAAIIGGP